jgi:hypothetical protein
MITVWAMLGSAFYFALMFDLWKRVGDDVDVHGLVAMVGTTRKGRHRCPHGMGRCLAPAARAYTSADRVGLSPAMSGSVRSIENRIE